MKLSPRVGYWSCAGAIVLTTALMTLFFLRGRQLQCALATGQFQTEYLHALNQLHEQIQTVRHQFVANVPCEMPRAVECQKPTVATQPPPETHAALILSGIYLNRDVPLAQINGRLFKPGDRIGRFTIKKIDPYRAILENPAGEQKTLRLINQTQTNLSTKL